MAVDPTKVYDPVGDGQNPYYCVWSPHASFFERARFIDFAAVSAPNSGLDWENAYQTNMIEGSKCGAFDHSICGDRVANKSAAHIGSLGVADPAVGRPAWIQGQGVFEFWGKDTTYQLLDIPERIWGDNSSAKGEYVVERYTAWTYVENPDDWHLPIGVEDRTLGFPYAVVFAEGMRSQDRFVRYRVVPNGVPTDCPEECEGPHGP